MTGYMIDSKKWVMIRQTTPPMPGTVPTKTIMTQAMVP